MRLAARMSFSLATSSSAIESRALFFMAVERYANFFEAAFAAFALVSTSLIPTCISGLLLRLENYQVIAVHHLSPIFVAQELGYFVRMSAFDNSDVTRTVVGNSIGYLFVSCSIEDVYHIASLKIAAYLGNPCGEQALVLLAQDCRRAIVNVKLPFRKLAQQPALTAF